MAERRTEETVRRSEATLSPERLSLLLGEGMGDEELLTALIQAAREGTDAGARRAGVRQQLEDNQDVDIRVLLPLILNAARQQEPDISLSSLREILSQPQRIGDTNQQASPGQVASLLGTNQIGPKEAAFPGDRKGLTGGDALLGLLQGLRR